MRWPETAGRAFRRADREPVAASHKSFSSFLVFFYFFLRQ